MLQFHSIFHHSMPPTVPQHPSPQDATHSPSASITTVWHPKSLSMVHHSMPPTVPQHGSPQHTTLSIRHHSMPPTVPQHSSPQHATHSPPAWYTTACHPQSPSMVHHSMPPSALQHGTPTVPQHPSPQHVTHSTSASITTACHLQPLSMPHQTRPYRYYEDFPIHRRTGLSNMTRLLTQEAVSFIQREAGRGPFFLLWAPDSSHAPTYASDTFRGTSRRGQAPYTLVRSS